MNFDRVFLHTRIIEQRGFYTVISKPQWRFLFDNHLRLSDFVMLDRRFVIFIFLAVVCLFDLVEGRGHLIDPPMRSSLWRYYPWSQMGVPKNVDDTGLNCGGYWVLNHAVFNAIFTVFSLDWDLDSCVFDTISWQSLQKGRFFKISILVEIIDN